MRRTYIKDLKEKVGKEVVVFAWVQTVRDQGGIVFLLLRDITGVVQCVVLKKQKDFQTAKGLSEESVVKVVGEVKSEEQAPDGFEMKASEIEVMSSADPELPIPVVSEKGGGESDLRKRLDWRWIDLRKSSRVKIFRLWNSLEEGWRKYLREENFIQIYTPSLMNTASESGAEVFEVKYFDRKAYLAQSPQFYKQMALAAGLENVFMVGPVFRAELSFTTRHMTEFTGWDFEFSFIESHCDVMDKEEGMLVSMFEQANRDLDLGLDVPARPFPRVTMKEAKEKLAKIGVKSEKEYDVSPEEERELSRLIKEETGHDFVFLTDYPIEARPFYHMRYQNDPNITMSFDLLYKGLEITTGAQREHRYDVLVEQARSKKMPLKALEGYFNFFKYGCPPHGGGGIGPGRIVMQMLDLSSVKEATFLPRDVKRLTP